MIDDERDYFAVESNRWISGGERDALRQKEEELREAKYGSRRNRAITLDFAGRKVVEEEQQLGVCVCACVRACMCVSVCVCVCVCVCV